jgi:hypothetical protein
VERAAGSSDPLLRAAAEVEVTAPALVLVAEALASVQAEAT